MEGIGVFVEWLVDFSWRFCLLYYFFYQVFQSICYDGQFCVIVEIWVYMGLVKFWIVLWVGSSVVMRCVDMFVDGWVVDLIWE